MLVYTIERGEFPDFSVRYTTEEEFVSTKDFPNVDMTAKLKELGVPVNLIGVVDKEEKNVYTLSMFDISINEFVEKMSEYNCREYDAHEDYLAAQEDRGDFKITVVENDKN